MANVLDVSTEDNLQYQFFPVSSGSVTFHVRAANDAHVALTMGPQESDPMYEVFIGGWKNTKSVIRRNRTKPDVAEVDTPAILEGSEFRGFWVRWDSGIVSAGRQGEAIPFISWADPEPFPVAFVGVCTGWGAAGTWKLEDGAEFDTPDKLEYVFRPVTSGYLELEYRGPHNCHVCLAAAPAEADPMYEFILGGWENTKSVVRYCRQPLDKVTMSTPGLVSAGEFRRFTFEWRCGRLLVRDAAGAAVLEWADPAPFPVTHFGVRTGWGARGQWRITHFGSPAKLPSSPSAPLPPTGAGSGPGVWVDAAAGQLPDGAVAGGRDASGETLYVARAQHEGALIPGKFATSHGCAYVAWGGAEHAKDQYQVLVGAPGNWVSTTEANIPPNAYPGGETEEGEALFVGRVQYEGSLTTGKVQPSHGVCYISFAGQELGFREYEILTA